MVLFFLLQQNVDVQLCRFVAYSNVFSQILKIQGGDARLLV